MLTTLFPPVYNGAKARGPYLSERQNHFCPVLTPQSAQKHSFYNLTKCGDFSPLISKQFCSMHGGVPSNSTQLNSDTS